MATCPKCKTFYLNDECPTCKKERLAGLYPSASKTEEPSPRRRNPAPAPDHEPEEEQYPRPGNAKKKPPREAMSMGGWAGWCTFLGIMMCIFSVPALFLASFELFFSLLFGSMPFFCLGKLFKCITEILSNQVEILNMLDPEK